VRAALTELHARVAAGTLHKRRLEKLIEHGLNAQQDWSQTWAPEWGSIIEAAWKHKSISDEQVGRYLRQSILMLFSDDRGTIPTSVAQSRLAEIPRSKYAGESTWIRSAM